MPRKWGTTSPGPQAGQLQAQSMLHVILNPLLDLILVIPKCGIISTAWDPVLLVFVSSLAENSALYVENTGLALAE